MANRKAYLYGNAEKLNDFFNLSRHFLFAVENIEFYFARISSLALYLIGAAGRNQANGSR